ncbi:NAD-dependent epimerase/dehydratase family protein [Pusillimonas minor]|uniref:NAD-dependent epimerase/dehydratase family protein n=1 Tax=Pusillimonas minor TaxID=2697024 RepID=A0A842HQ98_9BURK|nr:NAD-dependent epimerase/dehydratase family protein [Pusillimonas minor]MBC2769852.1 NAD-dependent epimerase/dehydratase family protein [Pusillimonas minor]
MNILITGGAGFIGSRLAARLHKHGHRITILDNLSRQVHGDNPEFSADLQKIADCIEGDVCDRILLADLVKHQEVIIHFAAETGTGQSMYAIQHYEHVNIAGTSVLLDILVNEGLGSVRKLVVASSRAVYGEGQYRCSTHGVVYPQARKPELMSVGQFEPICPLCNSIVAVEPTSEEAPFAPTSFYGLTKQVQEQMVLMFANALKIDGIALRYQNVYGPGQSLSNPYTGLLAVFSNLVRKNQDLNVFEDGNESRDFVYIDDVVEATASCVDEKIKGTWTFNVGSGVRTSVLEVAKAVINYFGANAKVNISGDFRVGDIRHNMADISSLKALTGFSPRWSFDDGLHQFLDWASKQDAVDAGFEGSMKELADRGLLGVKKP